VRALNRKLLREFGQLRGQVLAIGAVMVAGIATMVMAQSNYSALADTRALYYGEYRFADVFAGLKRAPLELADEVRALPGVRAVDARAIGHASLEIAGYDEAVSAQIVSLPGPGDAGLNRVFLRRGALPAADGEVVVGEAFALAHGLGPGDAFDAVLNGRRQSLRISGIGLSPEFVYQIRPGELFPDFERFGLLWMPRESLAAAFDLDGAFNDLAITLQRDAREADVVAALDALLAPYGGMGAHGRDEQVSHRFLDEELVQLRSMTRMFTAIFLGVAAFLLNVVVGRLIGAQREQIALLKAFGYTRREVALHYGQLALMVAGAGVLPGLALGAWLGRGLANLYMEFYRFPYLEWSLQPSLVALSFAFALAAAAMGTAGGLRRAFALPPAEAMRPEAPARFRRTLTERLGLGALLDPASRMILRNLERRPVRTGLSVFGIGLAVGVLVMSRFMGDAIDRMVAIQFGFAQRDDLTVVLTEPASGRAAEELAALPGVRAVEPFRNVAVRLRNGHREYRTALQGLPPDATLKRVLDRRLQPVPAPEQGLLLTDYLGELLAVRPGDMLEVTFLEGHRRSLQVPVAGLVSEYMGVGAYARNRTVNRLLDEDDAVSGAWIALSGPQARADVVRELRARPRVAAVTDRTATIQSFMDTMARTMLTFTLMITAMAACIAAGVVYNSARIILAERGRELASLRVLGYTRGEARGLLFGELLTLALLALLPGFALGYGMSALLVQGLTTDLYRIPLVLTVAGFAVAGLVVLAATVGAGLLVLRRLDRLDLVAVLKTKE
jgi:putative ABC transport system permease protein